jgi:hypothetical protein
MGIAHGFRSFNLACFFSHKYRRFKVQGDLWEWICFPEFGDKARRQADGSSVLVVAIKK